MAKRILAILVSLLLIVGLSVYSFADFGDFGGDSDYGDAGGYDSGYDSDYDSGYDSNDYYYYDYDTTSSNLTTSYYGTNGYADGNLSNGGCIVMNCKGEKVDPERSSTSNSSDNGVLVVNVLGKTVVSESSVDDSAFFIGNVSMTGVLGIVIFLLVALYIFKRRMGPAGGRSYRRKNTPVNTGVQAENIENLYTMAKYNELDPDFSANDLKDKISNLYVQMQNAWQDKNLETLRPYFTDALYTQYDRQLDAYRRHKQTNYIERIAVLSVDLKGWKQNGDEDIIFAEVRTRIVDYVESDEDGSLIRGDRKAEKFMTYEWALSRKTGVKTAGKDGIHTVNCPNCGAAVDINQSAKCPYCGSVITTAATDWVISGIKGLSQRTGH